MQIEEQLYVIAGQRNALCSDTRKANQSTHAISTQAMVDAILSPNTIHSKALRAQINGSIPLFKRYKYLLQTLSISHSENLAAASSALNVSQRAGRGFKLTIHVDPATEHQAYVSLVCALSLAKQHTQQYSQGQPANDSQTLALHIELDHAFYVLPFAFAGSATNIPLTSAPGNETDISTMHAPEASIRLQTLIEVNSDVYKALCDTKSNLYLSL